MNKRELMKTVFEGKAGDRVPIGFWWHFLDGKCHASGFYDNDYVDKLIEGHKKMLSSFKPDLLKIMSDGFFCHPGIVENNVTKVEDLAKIKHITKDHPWVKKQIYLVNEVMKAAGDEPLVMYNMFSAVQQLRLYCCPAH
jgi:uroporphyrinogen decarboxylase